MVRGITLGYFAAAAAYVAAAAVGVFGLPEANQLCLGSIPAKLVSLVSL